MNNIIEINNNIEETYIPVERIKLVYTTNKIVSIKYWDTESMTLTVEFETKKEAKTLVKEILQKINLYYYAKVNSNVSNF